MPSGARSNLFLLALIAGTTVAMFLLGAAVTMWLGIMPPAGAASAPSIISSLGPNPAGSPTNTASAASSPGSAPSVTSSPSASPAGSPASPVPSAPAKETAVSTVASPAPSAAASQTNGAGAAASSPASPAVVQAGAFSLQFGGFLDAAKAKSLIGELAARGYAPASVDVADGYGQMWHYVRFGGYADERAAALAASDLLQRTGIGAAIIRVSTANAGP